MTEDNEDKSQDKGQSRQSSSTMRKDRPVTDNPDVHLDAPQLKVDELNLNLLNILNVEAKGLETELLLEADLENLVGLLRRVVDALEDDEDSVSEVVESLGRAVRAATGGSYSESRGSNGQGSVKDALKAVRDALDSYGQNARYEVDESGNVTKTTLNEAGEVLDEELVGNVSELSGERS